MSFEAYVFLLGWGLTGAAALGVSPSAQQSQLRIEFDHDCLIPTGEKVDGVEIGGLSALQIDDKTGILHALSDNKGPHDRQWFRFRWSEGQAAAGQTPKQFCPVPIDSAFLKGPASSLQTDAEGMAFDSDGSFYVISEVRVLGDHHVTYPEVLRFSKEGVLEKKISVPEAYIPKTFLIPQGPAPVKPKEPVFVAPSYAPPIKPKSSWRKDNWIPTFVEKFIDFINRKLWERAVVRKREQFDRYVSELKQQHDLKIQDLRKSYEKSYQDWLDQHLKRPAGVNFNTAFEALSFDKSSRVLTIMSETSLSQDRDLDPRLIRFLRMKMSAVGEVTETKEYYYRVDETMRVSEILDLGRGQIIVLEISFDSRQRKVFSRLYEVAIEASTEFESAAKKNQLRANPANQGVQSEIFLKSIPVVVNKRLVFDLNSIAEKLSPAYPRLDNLEGMALGPILPSGHRSLLLVSDNNENYNQITQFLIFKLMK